MEFQLYSPQKKTKDCEIDGGPKHPWRQRMRDKSDIIKGWGKFREHLETKRHTKKLYLPRESMHVVNPLLPISPCSVQSFGNLLHRGIFFGRFQIQMT